MQVAFVISCVISTVSAWMIWTEPWTDDGGLWVPLCLVASSTASILILKMCGWDTVWYTVVAGAIGASFTFGILGFLGVLRLAEPGFFHKHGQGLDAAIISGTLSAVSYGALGGVVGLLIAASTRLIGYKNSKR